MAQQKNLIKISDTLSNIKVYMFGNKYFVRNAL